MSVSGANRDTAAPEKHHILYRFYTAEDDLLYVGITCNPAGRFREHRGSKDWWYLVSRIELEHLDSRIALMAAERRAVAAENPIFNVQMKRPQTVIGIKQRARMKMIERELEDRCR